MGYGDGEYTGIFEKILRPVTLEFDPDLILVSAGFDIHGNDPLGGMRVTPSGFAALTSAIMDIARVCCDGRIVFTLEGGYDLNGLRDSVKAVLREMAGLSETDHENVASQADPGMLSQAVASVIKTQSPYWKNLES